MQVNSVGIGAPMPTRRTEPARWKAPRASWMVVVLACLAQPLPRFLPFHGISGVKRDQNGVAVADSPTKYAVNMVPKMDIFGGWEGFPYVLLMLFRQYIYIYIYIMCSYSFFK